MWLNLFKLSLIIMAAWQVSAEEFDIFTQNLEIEEECEANGNRCIDCLTSHFCYYIGDGTWINETMTCDEGYFCNEEEGGICSKTPNQKCSICTNNYEFKCYTTGIYPDVCDCTTYYACKKSETNPEVFDHPIKMKCDDGFRFDSKTTLCMKRDPNDLSCNVIDDVCTAVGDTGRVLNNPFMFYVCLNAVVNEKANLNPNVFNCDGDQIYDDDKKGCKSAEGVPLSENNRCLENGLFYNPNDCKKYYRCVTNVPPLNFNCGNGQHFDKWERICVDACSN